MKALLAFVLAVAANAAVAGDYAKAVGRQDQCTTAGSAAASAHSMTQSEAQALLADIQSKIKTKAIDRKRGNDLLFYVTMGRVADSPREAYMRVWAECMDKK